MAQNTAIDRKLRKMLQLSLHDDSQSKLHLEKKLYMDRTNESLIGELFFHTTQNTK